MYCTADVRSMTSLVVFALSLQVVQVYLRLGVILPLQRRRSYHAAVASSKRTRERRSTSYHCLETLLTASLSEHYTTTLCEGSAPTNAELTSTLRLYVLLRSVRVMEHTRRLSADCRSFSTYLNQHHGLQVFGHTGRAALSATSERIALRICALPITADGPVATYCLTGTHAQLLTFQLMGSCSRLCCTQSPEQLVRLATIFTRFGSRAFISATDRRLICFGVG